MKKRIFTFLAVTLVATTSVLAQLTLPADSGRISSLVYLQFEDDAIIPEGVEGVTSVDGVDSAYIKTGTTTVGQEANRIEVDGEENVLWMDYDGHIKFDSTLINKDHFSISFDMKWSGANNVWYLGLWGVVGFDNDRVVITDGDTVPTPGYVHRQFQFANTGAHALAGGYGSNFPARDEWEHIVFTVDSGIAYLYRADSLSGMSETNFIDVPGLTQPEFYLGLKATVDVETGVVTGGRATNANADCKETQMSLDNVALFDVALTAEQVAIIYNGEPAAVSEKQAVSLNIYPNPVVDVMHFSNSEVASATIYSITGKQLKNTVVSNAQVDMSQIAAGLYLVKAYNQQGALLKTVKVMKK